MEAPRSPATAPRAKAAPAGRYLVRSGSVYLFQIRMPRDLVGGADRTVRIGLGALPAREARRQADLLAALARNRFDQIRQAGMERNEQSGPESSSEVTEEVAMLTAAEIKGYMKGIAEMVGQPAPPTPPHQEEAFAGFRGLVELNRELAKGAAGSPLILQNVELLKQTSIDRISGALAAGELALPAAVPPAVVPLAPMPGPANPPAASEPTAPQPSPLHASEASTFGPAVASAVPSFSASDRPKKIAAFKLDRRYVERPHSTKPLFSEIAQEYFETRESTKLGKNKDIGTARFRAGVFLELIGDHPIDTYTGADLQAYVYLLTHWPANQGDRPAGMSAREILAANAELTAKPLKRKALEDGYVGTVRTIANSRMTQYDYKNPFAGVKLAFPETAAPPESAEPLSSEQTSRIFRCGVERGLLDEAMLPLLGHLTGRRLGLLVHLKGSDIRQKYPGVWVAQTDGIQLSPDGKWRRVPIKTDASTSFFVLHDFLREIGFTEWAASLGDKFLFPELIRLADPSKSASQYMGRLFERAGVITKRKEVFHSLRGGYIDQMRDNKVDTRDRKLQAGHQLDNEHDFYGFKAIGELRAREIACQPLKEGIDFSVFREVDFDKLARAKRRSGRKSRP